MGRRPCCAKEGLNKGPWCAREDKLLVNYITVHGVGKWRDVPQQAGLMRCGKSCRLRWLNYLRPGIKRGNISLEEEDLIIRLHRLLGNRWSLIAGRLPGRTDNEIKNYWNTSLSKRVGGTKNKSCKSKKVGCMASRNHPMKLNSAETTAEPHRVIRTKAARCTKVVIPRLLEVDKQRPDLFSKTHPSFAAQQEDNLAGFLTDFDISELLISDTLSSGSRQLKEINEDVDRSVVEGDYYSLKNLPCYPVDCPDSAHEAKFENLLGAKVHENQWVSDPFQEILDLAFFLSSENEQIYPDAYIHSTCSMRVG